MFVVRLVNLLFLVRYFVVLMYEDLSVRSCVDVGLCECVIVLVR